MFSGRRAANVPEIKVGGHRVVLGKDLRYFSVTLDGHLSFSKHVKNVVERASAVSVTVARLMLNVGELSYSKRRMLMNVVMSRLLYAAPVWTERALVLECNRSCLIRAHRLAAFHLIRAYRTVSDEVALVLAGMTPVDILAKERARLSVRKVMGCQWGRGSENDRD